MEISDTYRGTVEFDPISFGRRLASAREWRGLRPKELAATLGRAAESINAMERGDRVNRPDKLVVEKLAQELGVSQEWLLGGSLPPWDGDQDERPVSAEELAGLRADLEDVKESLARVETLLRGSAPGAQEAS